MELVEFTQSFQAVIGGLKVLTSLTDKAKQNGATDEFTRELNTAIINMQSAVMDAQAMTLEAQSEQSRLISELTELREQAKRINDWVNERARYELIPRNSNQVYKLREDSRKEGEHMHYLCPICYEDGVKSVLQGSYIIDATDRRCFRCKLEF